MDGNKKETFVEVVGRVSYVKFEVLTKISAKKCLNLHSIVAHVELFSTL